MTDPAKSEGHPEDIIEAAERALTENSVPFASMRSIAEAVVTAVTPLILEKAAKVAEDHPDVVWEDDGGLLHSTRKLEAREVAAAIRAMKQEAGE